MRKDVKQNAQAICNLLYDKKAQDIIILDVEDRTIIADCFIICSGRSSQQVKALCDEVERKAESLEIELRRKEGYQQGRWIVLDLSDILLHIFHPEERTYYNIERLWRDEANCVDFSAEKAGHPTN